jgi:ABC-2 type transport system permease protein
VAGFTAWRTLGLLSIVGAIWGLLLATRLVRGEEDAGRWEVLLTGLTTRRGAAAQAVAGLAAGWVALWAVTAVFTVAVGRSADVDFSVTGSLFLATALAASSAVFMTVGVLVSQLAATRRQANILGAAFFGITLLLRMVADSGTGLGGLRWATPFGWAEELRPLSGSRLLPLVPLVALVIGAVALAVRFAGRRDLGASILPGRDARPARTALLASAGELTVRLTGGVVLAWIAALAVAGFVFGLVAQSASGAVTGSTVIEDALANLGGQRGGAEAYLGLTFLTAAALIAFAVAGQAVATRGEEAEGRLDHLLVRPVRRRQWLAGRLVMAAALAVLAGVVTGVTAWAGAASQHTGIGFLELVEAGVNVVPPALFVLGVGVLVFAVRPRWTAAVCFGIVAWSFLVVLLAVVVTTNHWIVDTAIFGHTAPAPAADPNWVATGWLVGLGAAAAAIGFLVFERRDLASA